MGGLEVKEMARRAVDGDKEAFVALIEACKPSLLGVARSILRNEEDVADALQDTVLDAFQNMRTLKKPATAKTWLTRILINNCRDALKRRKTIALEEHLPEESVEYDWDSSADVRTVMGTLTAGDRLVLTLFYVEDMSQRDVAKVLDVSENAAKQRIRRAKRHFIAAYEKGEHIHDAINE